MGFWDVIQVLAAIAASLPMIFVVRWYSGHGAPMALRRTVEALEADAGDEAVR